MRQAGGERAGQAAGRLPLRPDAAVRPETKEPTQVPDEQTAPVVAEIVTRTAAGDATAAIVRDLNESEDPCPTGRALAADECPPHRRGPRLCR